MTAEPNTNDPSMPLSKVPAFLKRHFAIQRTRQCVYQWTKRGTPSKHGPVIILKTILVGGMIHVTTEALMEFVDALPG